MSEYWKSAPKYWCKHCKTYVRDTKLEKQNHESTGKHQGAIKRFLRDLHRGHEREDREKQKAKDEVARLNGVTPGGGGGGGTIAGAAGVGVGSGNLIGGAPWRRTVNATASSNVGVSPAERAKQTKQLAEMGVAVPEEYRREMAMTGEWEIISQRIVTTDQEDSRSIIKPEGGDSKQEIKSEGAPLNIGIKRRRVEGQDEMEEAGERVVRRGWGSTTKGWSDLNEELDLNSLMGKGDTERAVKTEEGISTAQNPDSTAYPPQALSLDAVEDSKDPPVLKKEESQSTLPAINDLPTHDAAMRIENDNTEETLDTGIVFKKRKAKPVRQR